MSSNSASQWEYTQGTDWSTYLTQTEGSDLRSQWLRAWLVAPLGTARFEVDQGQFATAVFADDFRLFRKVLVWFQAEKTAPNPIILAGTLPWEQQQWFAYHLGWPSDFTAWRRLIGFILRRISNIPQRLYPEIVAIFEVWQNAPADPRNPTSQALLKQCASWLASIDEISTVDRSDGNSEYWREVPGLDSLRKSLRQLILRSSIAEPSLAADYLQSVTNSERIQEDAFNDIIAYSPILAQPLPQSVVDLSLTFLREELPDEQVAREKQKLHNRSEWRREVLTKPEVERSHRDKIALSSETLMQPIGNFSDFEWGTVID